MIIDDQANRDYGRRIAEQMTAEQFELLREFDYITVDGRQYDVEDLERAHLALIADIADIFETNDDGVLLHPGHGRPLTDLRSAVSPADLPDPDLTQITDELDTLIS